MRALSKKKRVLIYGVGKCGTLFAYEFLKMGWKVSVYDIDKQAELRAVINLKLIGEIERHIDNTVFYDLIILTAPAVTTYFQGKCLYIFANPVDPLFEWYIEKYYKIPKIIPCGASLNNARLKVMQIDEKLEGVHGYEKPDWLREESKKYLLKQREVGYLCHPAVYYAIQELKEKGVI